MIIAKTTLPDWATSWFSYSSLTNETRNPYDTNRDPGGSSSGTGAAVAANLARGRPRAPTAAARSACPPRSATWSASAARPGVDPAHRDVLPRDPAGHGRPDGAHGRRRGARSTTVIAGYRPRRPLQRGDDRRPAPATSTPGHAARARASASSPTRSATTPASPRCIAQAVKDLEQAGAQRRRGRDPRPVRPDRRHLDVHRPLQARPRPVPHRAARPADRAASPRPTTAGQYDKRLDLMDAIMDGPDEPDEDPEYLKRFAARHEFTLVVENVLARHDAIVYPSVQVPPPTLEGRKDWTTLTLPTNTLIASQTWLPAITVPGRLHARQRARRPRVRRPPVRGGDAVPARARLRAGDAAPEARLQPVRPLERDPERERRPRPSARPPRVGQRPAQLGHVLEVHAVEGRDERRDGDDRRPAGDLAHDLVLLGAR